jgi:hypothetical protein
MAKEHTNQRYGKELSDLSNELDEMGELVAGQIQAHSGLSPLKADPIQYLKRLPFSPPTRLGCGESRGECSTSAIASDNDRRLLGVSTPC